MRNSKILILGSSGMLGHKLFQMLSTVDGLTVFGCSRENRVNHQNYFLLDLSSGFESLKALIDQVNPDVVVNCVGAIKQKSYSVSELFYLNSSLPVFVDQYSVLKRFRFLHISTDCVFDGVKGNYSEDNLHYSYDDYGLSKRLGENINQKNLVIRTSIIGHELTSKKSLLEWFLSADNVVNGYSNVFYSGLTTLELAKHILACINNPKIGGLFNISSEYISKHDLLRLINEIYGLRKEIVRTDTPFLDRTLNSMRYKDLRIEPVLSWRRQILDMHSDFIEYREIYDLE